MQNYINGAFVPAQSGATLPNYNPSTGAPSFDPIPRSAAADIHAAVAAARAALPSWSSTPAAARAALLDRVADYLEARAPALARMEAEDAGKTLAQAAAVDIPRAVANFRFFAGAIRHDAGGEAFHMPDAVNFSARSAVGVAALITPWNLPLYLLSWKVAPALACGNTVVCKPSEVTPRTAGALAEAFHALGAPPGVFNLVHGLGGEAGAALVAHPGARLLSFTGGTATGAAVAAAAAPLFKRVSLELGGKNATILFADTPVERAVAAALRAGYTNNGQVCLCGSRVLVQRPIYEAVAAGLAAAVGALRVGDPLAPGVDVGPLCSAAHRDKVRGYIELGLREGGVAAAGGEGPPQGLPEAQAGGYFVRPTVFTGLDARSSRVAREEIFGPVVVRWGGGCARPHIACLHPTSPPCAPPQTVHPFDTEAEAIELTNDSPYGLCANVWTQNVGVAHRVARALDVGMVWVNCWLHRDLRTPFGGQKDSGLGREGGRHSLDFYSEMKNVCVAIPPA